MNHLRYLSIGQQKVLIVLGFFLLGTLFLKFYYPSQTPPEEITKEVVVEVSGEVQKPGVYLFQQPPLLKEAIEKAGGLKERGNFDPDSFSEPIRTGTLLNVRKESPQEFRIKIETMEAYKLLVFHIPLDLNRVSVEDLCLLPGVGESLAREIVRYREKRKAFRSIEELKNISGIGDKKWEILKPFLTVSPG